MLGCARTVQEGDGFMRGATLLFAVLTAALSIALAFQLAENRRLHDEILTLAEAQGRAAGIEPGQALAPFTVRDAAGRTVLVDFADRFAGTVLMFHAATCDACASTAPHWRSALEQAARPDVRFLCIQTDGAETGPLALDGLPASLAVPLPPINWLARLPAVPATMVLDTDGRVLNCWYGELEAVAAQELLHAIVALPLPGEASR